jgi:predicted nucleic acid-binding protein
VIVLDTSFLVRALVPGAAEDTELRRWLAADEELAISAVAWAEFLCGPLDREVAVLATAIVGEPLPLTAAHARRATDLFNSQGRRRGSLVDCLIAATAIEANAELATANQRDFQNMPGLRLA